MSEYPRSKSPRSKKKLLLFIGAPLLIILSVGAVVVSRNREKPIMITTDKAFRMNITQLVTATGKIQPEVEVKIAPEVSGEIVDMPVKEGQVVRKGDLLMKIKPDSYVAQVEQQTAALNGAKAASVQHRAEVDKASQDYDRAKRLFKDSLIPESDRKTAQTNYEMAKAALESSLFEIQRAAGALEPDSGRALEDDHLLARGRHDQHAAGARRRAGRRHQPVRRDRGHARGQPRQHGSPGRRQRERRREREGRRHRADYGRRLSGQGSGESSARLPARPPRTTRARRNRSRISRSRSAFPTPPFG